MLLAQYMNEAVGITGRKLTRCGPFGFVASVGAVLGPVVLCFLAGLPSPSRAEMFALPQPRRIASPQPLARGAEPPVIRSETNGTAFFVDESGDMLTARHAVEGCARVFVTKEGRYTAARVVALSARFDIALIKIPRTWGLAAVFPHSVTAVANDMVFAAAYDTLPGMIGRSGVMANATVAANLGGGEAGHLAMDSPVTFGASGAPVLDSRGLVEGIVSRRTAVNRVLAVDASEAKAFLGSNGIHIDEDDRPQMAGSGSRANRAASISARVTCLQN